MCGSRTTSREWCSGAKCIDNLIRGYQVNLQEALNTRLKNPILNFCYKLSSGRKGMKKARAHGIRVHSQDEITELGKSDLRVLSDLLGDKPFAFGNEPTLDVVTFANLAQLHFMSKEVEHPLREALNDLFPNLVGLETRVQERVFPEWEELLAPEAASPPPKTVKDKENKEIKEGAAAEKQPSNDEPEKGKGDEKEKELEKKPEEKNGKENEKEK